MFRSFSKRAARILALLVLAAPAAAQATWHVDVGGTPPGDGTPGNPYTSLQFCFAQPATVDGDSVLVAPGTYVEDLDLLGKSLDVRSTSGAAATILRPATNTTVLVAVGVGTGRLEGFTVRDGRGTSDGQYRRGGGILCSQSTLELKDCVLRESRATYGGNLCVQDGSSVTLLGCVLTAGQGWLGGGLHVEQSQVVAFETRFDANRAFDGAPTFTPRGTGIHAVLGATLELYGCEVTDNRPHQTFEASFLGAGLFLSGSIVSLEDCLVSSNGNLGLPDLANGGGIYADSSTVELRRCTVRDNLALHGGGGIYGSAGVLLEDCDVESNSAFAGGGTYGPVTLLACRVVNNLNYTELGSGDCSGSGGGVNGGHLVRCLLQGNRSFRQGGGAYNATLVECEVIENRAGIGITCPVPQGGAGIWGGSATDCAFRDNVVIGGPFSTSAHVGGAAAEATLVRCLIENNRIDMANEPPSTVLLRAGGGTWNCQLEDCVVQDNFVSGWRGQSAQGGGVHGGSAVGCVLRRNRAVSLDPTHPFAMGGGAALANLTRCVVYDNEADHGGGAWQSDLTRSTVHGNVANAAGGALSLHIGGTSGWGDSRVKDSIAWGNAPDEFEVGSGTLVVSYTDVAGGWPGTGNISADPSFWNGAAEDFHLRADSPCIDAGDPSAPPDPDGSVRDMGALTFDASYVGGPYVYCEAKTTSEGCVPSIGSSGSPSTSGPDDFVVGATELTSGQFGILFWGRDPAAVPFFGGTRCVANPIVRTPPTNSGGGPVACSGALDFHFSHAYLNLHGLVPGDRVFSQFWFRDPTHPDGTGTGLSDALDFTVLP